MSEAKLRQTGYALIWAGALLSFYVWWVVR